MRDNMRQKRYEEFHYTMNKWLEACDESEGELHKSDDFKIGYIKSLAATMFSKLPKSEREFTLAVLNESTVRKQAKR